MDAQIEQSILHLGIGRRWTGARPGALEQVLQSFVLDGQIVDDPTKILILAVRAVSGTEEICLAT